MSFFDALAQVLAAEAGFVDHPLDRGGPTNLGITAKTWAAYYGKPAMVSDIKALTAATVAPIYRSLFWDALKLDSLPPGLALAVFNQAVLRGTSAATKSLQIALGVQADGVMGPKTIEAANRALQKKLLCRFLRESQTALIRIVANSPDQIAFLAGWSNRIFDLVETQLAS